MKGLFAGLFVFALTAGCSAVSTDTANSGMTVESKVVEIHMESAEAPVVAESKRRKDKTIQTLPFGHGTCSGSFVDNDGDIITARHCIDGFSSFEVITDDKRQYNAVVVATSSTHDLALIHIDRRNTPYFKRATIVTRGEPISILGSPLGITDTLSQGIVARVNGDVVLIDCSALPGNSGGPVFNQKNELVGVVSAGFIVLYGTTHLNIAQSVDAVHFFLIEALAKKRG